MTRDKHAHQRTMALRQAGRLSAAHDHSETRLLALEIEALETGLTASQEQALTRFWTAHDRLEREVIRAYAVLHLIDPEACRRLREGEAL